MSDEDSLGCANAIGFLPLNLRKRREEQRLKRHQDKLRRRAERRKEESERRALQTQAHAQSQEEKEEQLWEERKLVLVQRRLQSIRLLTALLHRAQVQTCNALSGRRRPCENHTRTVMSIIIYQ